MLPNDEAEQDRLDLHHHIFGLTLGGRLFRAPITVSPERVLDFGTGATYPSFYMLAMVEA